MKYKFVLILLKKIFVFLHKYLIVWIALLISIMAIYSNHYKVDNTFKAILIHEDMEDFFILANEGNRDQILIDYYYGLKYHPDSAYWGILQPGYAEPVIIKPGEKIIAKPKWSLDHFISMQIDTNYWYDAGPLMIKMDVDEDAKNYPFIVGMAFKYLKPDGSVNVKYFNYAIYTPEGIIIEDLLLDSEFIYLNE